MEKKYSFTISQFIIDKGYFNELFSNLLTLIGWTDMITVNEFSREIIAIIIATLAGLYCCNRYKKHEQYILLSLGILFTYATHYILKSEFNIGIIIASCMIIAMSNLKSDDLSLHDREISTFFVTTIVIVFAIFMIKHYEILCNRGVNGAMHGRYYYIAIFPMLYLLFHSLEKVKHTKYIPITLMTAMVLCEAQTVMQCILLW